MWAYSGRTDKQKTQGGENLSFGEKVLYAGIATCFASLLFTPAVIAGLAMLATGAIIHDRKV